MIHTKLIQKVAFRYLRKRGSLSGLEELRGLLYDPSVKWRKIVFFLGKNKWDPVLTENAVGAYASQGKTSGAKKILYNYYGYLSSGKERREWAQAAEKEGYHILGPPLKEVDKTVGPYVIRARPTLNSKGFQLYYETDNRETGRRTENYFLLQDVFPDHSSNSMVKAARYISDPQKISERINKAIQILRTSESLLRKRL